MKASEVIHDLAILINAYGDLQVVYDLHCDVGPIVYLNNPILQEGPAFCLTGK